MSPLDAGENNGGTSASKDKNILRMAVMERAATSRTTAQQIQSVACHSVSPHTIRRRLKQIRIPLRGVNYFV
ncbi:hypothetical protein TNCV_1787241 [Trichonephila clavipes]|nr:hypothetical protein TNCV_1787241 [Trichonephila clavipes]